MKDTPTVLAIVRFTREGWHKWPHAPKRRAYLAARHRHLFHFEVGLEVKHRDREVEFHDLLDFCKALYHDGHDFEEMSCESIAAAASGAVRARFPERHVEVAVFEDGEVGAKISTPGSWSHELLPMLRSHSSIR